MTEQGTRERDQATPGITRRSFATGVAWAVPAVAVAAAAPAHAVSLINYPGINGWIQNAPSYQGGCAWRLEVDSNPTRPNRSAPYSPGLTDGAPFGLYLYDVEPTNTFSNAGITYWIIGEQTATWETRTGHGTCWSGPVRGTPATQADGLLYTPYTWSYGCPIDAANYAVDPIDGNKRLYLQDFHVQTTFTQPWNFCLNVTYWAERYIDVDPDGAGTAPAQHKCFKRRNGTNGTFNPATVYC